MQRHDAGRRLDRDAAALVRSFGGHHALAKSDRRLRLHVFDRAQQIAQGREIIRTHVEDRSAARLEEEARVRMPVLHAMRHQRTRAGQDGSDLAAIDQLAGQPAAGAEERVRRATEFQSAPVRFLNQPMPVFRRDAERLFREYMLARGQRRMADLEMRVGRGQIDHHIHLRIAQQRVDRERANAELVGLAFARALPEYPHTPPAARRETTRGSACRWSK